MARLKFDLQPVGPPDGKTLEEVNAWRIEWASQYEWAATPAPCTCGFYIAGTLCGCRPEERARETPERVARRLEGHYRGKHERGLRAKRVFPGPPCDGLGVGWCRWCGVELLNEDGSRSKQRKWHAACLSIYFLHTDHMAQRRHLRERDGEGCKICHGPYCEVDHVIALGAAWEAFPEPDRRRWFFSPRNLQLLCGAHHRVKSREDVAFIKACQSNGQEWARAEVLRRLNDAGLLRAARSKGAA